MISAPSRTAEKYSALYGRRGGWHRPAGRKMHRHQRRAGGGDVHHALQPIGQQRHAAGDPPGGKLERQHGGGDHHAACGKADDMRHRVVPADGPSGGPEGGPEERAAGGAAKGRWLRGWRRFMPRAAQAGQPPGWSGERLGGMAARRVAANGTGLNGAGRGRDCKTCGALGPRGARRPTGRGGARADAAGRKGRLSGAGRRLREARYPDPEKETNLTDADASGIDTSG